MKLLYLPWSRLTPEEQETAIQEARRRGALGARTDLTRYQMDRGDPVPTARPALYVHHILLFTAQPLDRDWRRRTAAELCEDLRVCTFGDAWERARRALLGEPAPPRDVPTLALRVLEARDDWTEARRDYRDRTALLRRSGALPVDHPDRLAAGNALVRVIHTRDDYWLAVMLARAAGWQPPLRTREEGREVPR